MKKTMRGRRKRQQGNAEGGAGHGNGEIAAHRDSRGDPGTSRNAAPDDAAILGATATTPLKEVAVNKDVSVTPLATGKKRQAPSTDSKCYTRRRAEVAAPSSCPAFSKRHRFRRQRESASCSNNIENASSDTDLEEEAPKAKTIFPVPKKFLEEQKAYFAEVDAFELQEEVSQDCCSHE